MIPDEIGRWILKDFTVQLDDIETTYTVLTGKKIDDLIYLTQYDPQILINLDDNHCSIIKISFYCFDGYANTHLIMDKIDQLDEKLDVVQSTLTTTKNLVSFMENLRSWKITKPLRDISNVIRRLKKHQKQS